MSGSLLQNITHYVRTIYRGLRSVPNLSLSALRKVFSLMGRREKIAVGILLVLAAINLYASLRWLYYSITIPAPAYGGVYVEGMLGQPGYINPLLALSDTDEALEKLVYSGLFTYDSSGKLVPDLADGQPAISEDQKQYTINLRRNVKWHNDRNFTADDVVFTIQTLQNPSFKSPQRDLWLSTSVEKLSDYQVRFTTKDISGPFVNNLTLPILPKSVWELVDPSLFLTSQSNLQAIGTGPYSIKEIKKQLSGRVDQISFSSYSNFYRGKANIDTILVKFYDTSEDLLNALHSKEIQGFGFVSLDKNLYIDNTGDSLVHAIPLPQYQVLFFNLRSRLLADPSVRLALSQAVDRKGILDSILKNSAQLPTTPFDLSSQRLMEPQEFNLQAATQLLEKAGWKVDPSSNTRKKNGATFELTLATNDSLLNSKVAESIASSWRQLHIQVSLNIQPTKQLTDTVLRPRKFDVLIFPQKFGADPDPFVFWHSSQINDPGVNIMGFEDLAADKLMAEARSTTDPKQRQDRYLLFEQLLVQKIPLFYLSQTQFIYVLDKEIKNADTPLLYDPSDRFRNVSSWYIEERRKFK